MKIMKSLIGVAAAALFLVACDNKGGYKTTESGLKYKMYKQTEDTSKRAHLGDMITFHFTATNSDDSVFNNSFAENKPVKIPLLPPTYKGCIFEGFAMMGPGDSASFVVSADSLFLKTFGNSQLPPFVKPGTEVTFQVKMVEVIYKKDLEERMMKEKVEKMQNEIGEMENYFKKNNLTFETTENGVKYTITKKTNGRQAKVGDKVEVAYTGRLLDGTVFDSSEGKAPYPFTLGKQEVIEGWDTFIPMLKEGEKATIVVPFSLAYGERGSGPIPPYGTLVFDIELVKIH